MVNSDYTSDSIGERSDIEQIQKNPGMFIGSTKDPTRLFEEVLDNALDEAQSGFCDIIGVFIDTKTKVFCILDNGRGFPFNENEELLKDKPVFSSIKLFTSGKFNKENSDSPYKITSGLHGVGLVACFALSDVMSIEIYRDNKHALYGFKNADISSISRKIGAFKGKAPFSTKVTVKPNKNSFETLDLDVKRIEERLVIACVNVPNLKIALRVDGENKVITGTEESLISEYLSKDIEEFYDFSSSNRKGEKYFLKLGWEPSSFGQMNCLSCVNLIRVHEGIHINKIMNIMRGTFEYYAKKGGYHFEQDDIFQGFKLYVNMSIIKTAFAEQIKTKLEVPSDIRILDSFEPQLKQYLNKNKDVLESLLSRFQSYREAIQSKKITKKIKKKTRGSSSFTKLRDCTVPNGELIIGEGDSAVGGLIDVKESNHAILPLRGVIPNACTKSRKKLLENAEISDIANALGTGFGDECNIEDLRYSKILLACDADPAGYHITVLLIALFAILYPAIIQAGRLFVVRTPLFGTRRNGVFIPLWNEEEVNEAVKNKEHISRFKGLGSFNPDELKVFTLEASTRKLIKVEWSTHCVKLLKLLSSSEEKRNLMLGTWKLEDDS